MSVYTPVAVRITPFTEIVDGEDVTASSVMVPFEACADGTLFATELAEGVDAKVTTRRDVFNASGTWTCPAGVTRVTLQIRGGGGGGGGGAPGTSATTVSAAGGGGGGASVIRTVDVAVVPTTVYTVTVGAGGAGGAGGTGTPVAGSNGGDTTFGALATATGACGGQKGKSPVASDVAGSIALGGGPTRLVSSSFATMNPIFVSGVPQPFVSDVPGHGGAARNDTSGFASQPGTGSLEGFAGGAAGTIGTLDGSIHGGGGGGGGGAGSAAGGAAGNGGNGNDTGVGSTSAGTAGSAAAANSGSGGGGGGAGGQASAGGTVGVGGAGGAGGSGICIVSYFGPQAVVA
jgi:hypothetical protein